MAGLATGDYQQLIDLALAEDLGEAGDVTSSSVFEEETLRAVLVSKDTGVLAGAEVFAATFHTVDPATRVQFHMQDGSSLRPGDGVASIEGRAVSVLSSERISINFLSFLSGIASVTRAYVAAAASTGRAVILDTRKTLPGYRMLSKYAVRLGGGQNHRMGLYDMVMLKDNHIDRAGSIARAVAKARERYGSRFRIEVECRTLEHVEQALSLGVDVIMLDNMDLSTIREAVDVVAGRVPLEASGNMTLERVPEVSAAGVDFISVGKLTHSVSAFDFSLRMGGD